jgi:Kef-type K+ transport system membrane component KefB
LHAPAQSAVGASAEHLVLHVLYQLIAILLVTRAVVALIRRTGQTRVSGEILAGLLLGPSCLGALFPGAMHSLFDPSTSPAFVAIAQIGLVLLMFQVGLEFEFTARLQGTRKAVVLVSGLGILLPFALGFAAAPWFLARLPETTHPAALGFRLFFAIAMSITAIPILGRIFMELRLSHTRTAALTISAAAIDDVAGWLLLGLVSLVVEHQFSWSWLLAHLSGVLVYGVVLVFAARPLLKRWIARHLDRTGELRQGGIALLLLVLFISAAITSNLGLFAIIGGFCIGLALHDDRRFVAEWKRKVSPLVNTLFLPVFFAFTGLRTDIGSLDTGFEWWICALVCALAFATKFGGAWLGARLAGEPNRSALTLGVCMNTRALMELVAINIGYDLGVLPRSMFTKLVIMAILSTFIATPLIRWLMRDERQLERDPLQAYSPAP